jgi:hypothetical protein
VAIGCTSRAHALCLAQALRISAVGIASLRYITSRHFFAMTRVAKT